MKAVSDVAARANTRWRRGFWVPLFCAIVALPVFATAPVKAQLFPFPAFSGPGVYQPVAHRTKKRRRVYRARRTKKTPPPRAAWYPAETVKDPVQIVISLPDQKATVYQGEKVLVTSRVSSGKKGYSTPTGVFSILQKNRFHRSNIYSRAPMPFMQRLTWSGIALHASNSVPNYPASHGCVRLPSPFAGQLFRFTEMGAHVVIAKSMVAPVGIEHDKLFQPASPAPKDFDVVETERNLARAGVKLRKEVKPSTSPIRILVTRRTGRERLMDIQRLLNELQFNAGDVDGWMGPDTASAIKRFQATYGMTVDGFASDRLLAEMHRVAGKPEPRNGHIYARQDFRQLFDAPIDIDGPDRPLGAHLFTAMHFDRGAEQTRWLSVTLNKQTEQPRREAMMRQDGTASDQPDLQPIPIPASTAAQALDRIEIPDSIRQRISELLTPGSSLAISDDGLSIETFPKGTDFVVLTDPGGN